MHRSLSKDMYYIRTYMYIYVHVYVYIYTYIYIYAHIHVCIYIYIYIQIHMHIYSKCASLERRDVRNYAEKQCSYLFFLCIYFYFL